MGSFSIWHWLVVLVVVLLLFGRGKIPQLASDFAQGIKNFKKGLTENKDETAKSPDTAGKPLEGSVLPNQQHSSDPAAKDKVA